MERDRLRLTLVIICALLVALLALGLLATQLVLLP
jgi:hypothetical protein